jgi:hypothetical protein
LGNGAKVHQIGVKSRVNFLSSQVTKGPSASNLRSDGPLSAYRQSSGGSKMKLRSRLILSLVAASLGLGVAFAPTVYAADMMDKGMKKEMSKEKDKAMDTKKDKKMDTKMDKKMDKKM